MGSKLTTNRRSLAARLRAGGKSKSTPPRTSQVLAALAGMLRAGGKAEPQPPPTWQVVAGLAGSWGGTVLLVLLSSSMNSSRTLSLALRSGGSYMPSTTVPLYDPAKPANTWHVRGGV